MPSKHRDRSRSRSPHRGADRPSHRSRSPLKPKKTLSTAKALPLKARPLHKDDLSGHRQLFALYLDVQKQIDAEDLDDRELRGRWKSFVKKWCGPFTIRNKAVLENLMLTFMRNNGDLAEGWYDPETKSKADSGPNLPTVIPRPSNVPAERFDSDDEDDFGPAVPSREHLGRRAGPTVPKLQDLDLRDGMFLHTMSVLVLLT